MSRISAKRSWYRILAIWASVLSWMHWRRRREQRLLALVDRMLEEQDERLLRMLDQIVQQQMARQERVLSSLLTRHLMELGRPLSQALSRQDARREETQQETLSLLTEVLNSLQPTTEQMLLGSRPEQSSISSARPAPPSRRT